MGKIVSAILILLLPVASDGWQQVTGGPPARYGHSMVKIGNKHYVYGGVTSSKSILGDLWEYDESTTAWTQLTPSNPPLGRKFHAAAAVNGKMYVFAGETETTGIIQDIWEYDPQANSWLKKNSGGPQVPLPRIHHRAVSVGNKVWITGGTLSEIFGDIWCYDVTTQKWEKGTSFDTPRYGHVAGYYDGNIIIHGGAHQSGFRNDTLSYNIATKKWTTLQSSSSAPQNTKFAASAWEANVLWVSGGTTKDSNGNYPEVKATYEYNMATKQWTKKTDGPASTMGTGTTLNNNGNTGYKTFLFGGFRNGQAINEAWQYTGA